MSSPKATDSKECSGASRSPGWSRLVLVAFLMFLAAACTAHAQDSGSVSGVVVSTWDGANIPGVIVTVRGTTLATQTDATGRYQLNGLPPGENVLRFSKSGFASAVVTDVRVIAGQTTPVNGSLRPEFFEMEEYEVTAEVFTEQSMKILDDRKSSTGMVEGLGADAISKAGAGDVGEALLKVSGASLAGGKFAVIRGLADRYTTTTYNGLDIPSADPDRRAVQLDLFPSKFVSRIDVSKTFSPDIPGGFAGGAINIVPRQIPEKFEFEADFGMSYNSQASLRDDFAKSDRGSRDWLAMDDGKRRMPGIARRSSPTDNSSLNTPAFKRSFNSSQMAPVYGDSPLNSSGALAFGDSRPVKIGRVGYLAGMTYKNNHEFYDDGEVHQYQQGGAVKKVTKTDLRGLTEYLWSANVALGWEMSEDHQLGFNFMFVQTAEDEARRLRGQNQDVTTPGESYLEQDILKWTERNLTYYQLHGGHKFEDLKDVRVDWAAALANTYQDEPDSRIIQFLAEPQGPSFNPNGTVDPTKPFRNWRLIEEENRSGRIDLTVPLPSYNEKENAAKFGLAYSSSERTLDQRAFSAVTVGRAHPFYQDGDPNQYLAPGNLQYINYENYSQTYKSIGRQKIESRYAMGDWHVFNWLRLSGGVRAETTDLVVDTVNLTVNGEEFSSDIKRTDVLPAATATVYLRENLLLRGAWSETVVRPTYREISPAAEIDPVRGRRFRGNPDLQFSEARNLDLRLEWYPRPGSLIAVSAFLKKISGPIEQTSIDVNNELVTFTNSPDADVRGVEFELRENLGNLWKPLEPFSIGFSAAYIESEVDLDPIQREKRFAVWADTEKTRPLYDQPEYVLNGDITWDYKPFGTRVTLSGGVVGRRLTLVGLGEPDDYEEPTPQLDVFVSQQIGKHWKLKLSAKNLLDPVYETTQEWPTGKLRVESYTKGMTFGMSLGCSF
jgi:outer membrane receptor protein involved in Fe transport